MNSKNESTGSRRRQSGGKVAGLLALALASVPIGNGGLLVAQDSGGGRPLSLEAALTESLAGNASLRIAAAQAVIAACEVTP